MGGHLHPSLARVRLAVRQALAAEEPGSVVVVACSGGPDSLALASATIFEARKLALRVVGVTVDHELQEGSAAQAIRVVRQLTELGAAETFLVRVEVTSDSFGPEAAARKARYIVLGEVAERTGAGTVLLGHTRDDQAETVLLGLARGSGGRSLAGMRRSFTEGSVTYRRPLLDVARDDTLTACQVEGLDPWADPHNIDPGYARVRVRHRVLPVLENELGPGVGAALARTAELVRDDVEMLDDVAAVAYLAVTQKNVKGIEAAGLATYHRSIRTRVLRLVALAAGALPDELGYDHLRAMDALVTDWHGQQWVELPGHVRASRSEGRIYLTSTGPAEAG